MSKFTTTRRKSKCIGMGRGGCYEREGRRSWRLLGHACVATLLLVNAVANSTRHSNCTATGMETNHPRSCGRVLGHHFGPLPSISPHHDCLPRSCLRPSGSAAAPELPVLEFAGQHRISTIVTPTSSKGPLNGEGRTSGKYLVKVPCKVGP